MKCRYSIHEFDTEEGLECNHPVPKKKNKLQGKKRGHIIDDRNDVDVFNNPQENVDQKDNEGNYYSEDEKDEDDADNDINMNNNDHNQNNNVNDDDGAKKCILSSG